MRCGRGKAEPDELTRTRLFAASGGYCGKPDCARALFREVKRTRFHLAEIAHIFAAGDKGPRANKALTRAERGAFENLILLCALCHTEIDKLPDIYTDDVVRGWKEQHAQKLARVFGVQVYSDRLSCRRAIQPIFDENLGIFDNYGPENEYRNNPESDMAVVWRRKMLGQLLPNNHRILATLDANRTLMTEAERRVVEEFRQHVDDQWHRHAGGGERMPSRRYPAALNAILVD
ncbi:MAG: hypothetical protein ABL986_22300 [Vicinamibacterales bacterium]